MAADEEPDTLMRDAAFVEKFKAAASPEEIIAIYKEQGIDLPPESAKASYDFMHQSGELDERALEAVNGGAAGRIRRLSTDRAASRPAATIPTVFQR